MSAHTETYVAPPSALHYMLQAFRPSSGWNAGRGFPNLNIIWRDYLIEPEVMHFLQLISGMQDPRSQALLSLLVPHITGFRILMAMLTHPLWPLSIWRALQVRNRLSMYRPLRVDETTDLFAQVAGWRVLDKGLEVDLNVRLKQRDECAWESVVTFYYRGRFGSPLEQGTARGAAPISPGLDHLSAKAEQWHIDGADRWHFGALTGDYNGIHQWNWYARYFGFAAAFAHPQRVAVQCLGHLPLSGSAPQHLDLWIKGPAYYGSEVIQRYSPILDAEGQDFALWVAGDDRPALVGSLHRAMSV